MLYCTRQQLQSFLLEDYLAAVDEKTPHVVDVVMREVSAEIDSALGRRYATPFEPVPELVRYVAAVLAAYRVAGSLTSLVDTEGSTENPWLPLQREWKRATSLLDDIATGRRKLPYPAVQIEDDAEEPSIAVVTRPPLFDLRGL